MNKVYYIAVVGCGDIAERGHFPSLHSNKRVKVVAVSDLRSERAEMLATRYGVPVASEDYRDIIGLPHIDAVFVLTPPNVTAKVTIAALQAGKDVFCEKPMGISLQEALQIRDAEQRSGRLVQVGFKNIRSPLMERLKQRIDEGWFGVPLVYRISTFDEAFSPDDQEHGQRIRAALRDGSPMIHEGAHIVDFLRWFTNGCTIKRVVSTGVRTNPEFFSPNYVSSLVEFSNGDVAKLEAAWMYPHFFPGELHVWGPHGVASMSRAERTLTFHDGKKKEIFQMEDDWNTICFAKQLSYFVECLDSRLTPVPGSLEGVYGLRYTTALERSLLERRQIDVEVE